MKKIIHIFVLVVASSFLLSACTLTKKTADTTTTIISTEIPTVTPASETTTATESTKRKASYEFTATVSGQIALDLIQENATIETKDYGEAGKFVNSINGLEGNSNYYWAFYLNDKYAEQGASQTKLAKGDIIKFVYEAVTPTK